MTTRQELKPAIFQDTRLRVIDWHDLVPVTRAEILYELLLPAAWLGASLAMAHWGYYAIALAISFMFFLSGLRLVHNAFYSALGLSRSMTSGVLWAMSLVMLGSMHAVRFNHLQHHRLTLGEGDVEGRSALLFGPYFPILLHIAACREGDSKLRLTVAGQLPLNLASVWFVFGATNSILLRYQMFAMLSGQCMTAFFAVRTVHHHCDRTHYIARTLRHRIKNGITFNIFLHIEHHLFPRVPTCHLPELSRRIDRVAPELRSKIVFYSRRRL